MPTDGLNQILSINSGNYRPKKDESVLVHAPRNISTCSLCSNSYGLFEPLPLFDDCYFHRYRLGPVFNELFGISTCALDLRNGWDADTWNGRCLLRRWPQQKRPFAAMYSPPCTMHSPLMRTNVSRMNRIILFASRDPTSPSKGRSIV